MSASGGSANGTDIVSVAAHDGGRPAPSIEGDRLTIHDCLLQNLCV